MLINSKISKQLLIIFLLAPCIAWGQKSSSISGYVKGKKTGNPLNDANITLAHTNRGASSDTSGHFSITDVEAGIYTLIVSYVGYQKTKKKFGSSPGKVYN